MESKSANYSSQHPLPVVPLFFCQPISGQNFEYWRNDLAGFLFQRGVVQFGEGHDDPVKLIVLPDKGTVRLSQGEKRIITLFARYCQSFLNYNAADGIFTDTLQQLIQTIDMIIKRRRFKIQALRQFCHGKLVNSLFFNQLDRRLNHTFL